MTDAKSMEDLVSLCKRRGFVYPASEIYGGLNGFWDYGPLGTQLKNNLRDAWWQDNVLCPPTGPDGEPVQIVGLDSSIIQNPKVWEASGHVGGFNDPMIDCRECKSRFRADQVFGGAAWSTDLLFKKHPELEPLRNEVSEAQLRALVQPDFEEFKRLSANIQPLVDFIERGSRLDFPLVSVVASNAEEAVAVAQPLVAASKQFRGLQLTCVHSLEDWPDDWAPCPCPNCLRSGTLTSPRPFNLMFRTFIGATATEDDIAYLRPETAQGIFINFKNVMDTSRVKMPFGIAQVGKSFRNEVTPRNFIFRSREFEQMEMEFFCHPDEARKWFEFWRDQRMGWWKSIGLTGSDLQLRQHDSDELSHYAKEGVGTADVEYRYPFTSPDFGELEGIAHRTDFDMRQHAEHSGLKDKLKAFDPSRGEIAKNGQPKGERFFPHVIEPAAGLTRGVLAVLCEAYTRDDERASPEIMKFHPRLAPTKAAVFPLVNKDGMPEVASKLVAELRAKFGRFGMIETDAKQSIGKRYARMDEAGCPFCFTIDGETLSDQTVTVRDRDTAGQERISLERVAEYLGQKLGL